MLRRFPPAPRRPGSTPALGGALAAAAERCPPAPPRCPPRAGRSGSRCACGRRRFRFETGPLPAQPGQRADAARLCSVLLIGFTRRRGKRKKGTQDRQTCSLPVNNEIEGGCCCCSNPLNTGPCFSQAMHFGIRRRMHAVAAWI